MKKKITITLLRLLFAAAIAFAVFAIFYPWAEPKVLIRDLPFPKVPVYELQETKDTALVETLLKQGRPAFSWPETGIADGEAVGKIVHLIVDEAAHTIYKYEAIESAEEEEYRVSNAEVVNGQLHCQTGRIAGYVALAVIAGGVLGMVTYIFTPLLYKGLMERLTPNGENEEQGQKDAGR